MSCSASCSTPGTAMSVHPGVPVYAPHPCASEPRIESSAGASTSASAQVDYDRSRYELVRELGAGSFGVAWLMRDRRSGELVACKLIERGDRIDKCGPRLLRRAGVARSAIDLAAKCGRLMWRSGLRGAAVLEASQETNSTWLEWARPGQVAACWSCGGRLCDTVCSFMSLA